MKTVGQILKKERLAQNLDLTQIATNTRIQLKFLQSLEEDAYHQLPSATIARGFIRNYGQALGLNPNTLLALFRRDFIEDKSGQIIPRGIVKPLTDSPVSWTPNHTLAASAAVILILLSVYLYREYMIFISPPPIKIEAPQQNAEIKGNSAEIVGKTDPETQVLINGEEIKISSSGQFKFIISLVPGENEITIKVTDKRGKVNTIQRTIQAIP